MKQVIVIRKDLNMRKGKMIAQGAHASLEASLDAMVNNKEWFDEWYDVTKEARMKKIVVYVKSEAELAELFLKAGMAHNEYGWLPRSLIQDAGLTEFKEPTFTAMAVGPAPDELVDTVTKELPLL